MGRVVALVVLGARSAAAAQAHYQALGGPKRQNAGHSELFGLAIKWLGFGWGRLTDR